LSTNDSENQQTENTDRSFWSFSNFDKATIGGVIAEILAGIYGSLVSTSDQANVA
jgi:hypothetical protein